MLSNGTARSFERLRAEILGPARSTPTGLWGSLRRRISRAGTRHEGPLTIAVCAGLYLLAIGGVLLAVELGPTVPAFVVGTTALSSSGAISSHLCPATRRT